MMVQTKCKLNNLLTYPQTVPCLRNNRTFQNGKVRFRLNIDVRTEMEDSRLNDLKQLITFVRGRLNFSWKSTTAANSG